MTTRPPNTTEERLTILSHVEALADVTARLSAVWSRTDETTDALLAHGYPKDWPDFTEVAAHAAEWACRARATKALLAETYDEGRTEGRTGGAR